jgi:hypothetical protein
MGTSLSLIEKGADGGETLATRPAPFETDAAIAMCHAVVVPER